MKGHPMCEICKRPVERLVRWTDPMSLHVYFKAYCHGDERTSMVSLEQIEDGGVSFGTAFEQRSIATGEDKI